MKRALLFPGQGSQKVGMGETLIAEFSSAKRVFEEADDALGFPLSKICFEGPEAELARTEITQPAILATSIAAWRALSEVQELSFDYVAGHSLGEWTAHVAAGSLSLTDALRLVHLRGKAMQSAVPEGVGGMAAIMGLDATGLAALCEAAAQGQILAPANFNGATQTVISGHLEAVKRACDLAKPMGATRAIPLKVSAPFHCELMKPAAVALQEALGNITLKTPCVPVVTNVTARPCQEASELKELLVKQVTSAILWEETVMWLQADGVTQGLELGQGSVLRGLIKRMCKTMIAVSVGNAQEIAAWPDPQAVTEPKQQASA